MSTSPTPAESEGVRRLYQRPELRDTPTYKLLACEIVCRELCRLASEAPAVIDVEFMPKGLHDAGKDVMRRRLQQALDAIKADDYDAILLGYARCNDGVVGLRAPQTPLVIPRAHDCITFFFGSAAAYQAYFNDHPGTYFRSTGWTERDMAGPDSVMQQLGLDGTFEEYVAQYGRENAEYIMESLGGWEKNYQDLAYIDMGLPMEDRYATLAEQEAQQKGLRFRRLAGSWQLLTQFIYGQWDSDHFLVVPPGQTVIADDSGTILACR